MAFRTYEKMIDSSRGYKRPLYSYTRSYRTFNDVRRRISQLIREYGEDNVIHMPCKDENDAALVYVRVR